MNNSQAPKSLAFSSLAASRMGAEGLIVCLVMTLDFRSNGTLLRTRRRVGEGQWVEVRPR